MHEQHSQHQFINFDDLVSSYSQEINLSNKHYYKKLSNTDLSVIGLFTFLFCLKFLFFFILHIAHTNYSSYQGSQSTILNGFRPDTSIEKSFIQQNQVQNKNTFSHIIQAEEIIFMDKLLKV